jgi:23S rRNA pseudouridine2605 synthase
MSERIQKALATAGIASRREIEKWIAEGRIQVNGRPAAIGQKVDHEDKVRVDGKLVALQRKAEPTRVLLFRKRVGEMVTRDDPQGRRTVFRKLPELETGRWIAVGRLDINTSGLLLLTNDGELARRLTHPSFEIEREYSARVLGEVDEAVLERLRSGVTLDDGEARFVSIAPGLNEDGKGANQWYTVTVREGRNRLVRRLFESQGLQVSRLIRTAYGPIQLGRGIKTGGSRDATPAELAALLAAVGMEPEKPQKPQKSQKPQRPEKPVTPARREPRGRPRRSGR